ncbi:MAG: hypothetical protein Q9170_001164 [Blastenia crenularia]
MPSTTPTPQHLTLRFKRGKDTIILLVHPHEPLTTVKSNILQALESTIPSSSSYDGTPEDIILGVPVDPNDPNGGGGWIDLEIPPESGDEGEGEEGSRKEKKKMSTGKGGKKKGEANGVLNDTAIGAGLKDGMVLAFRFRRDAGGFDVVMPAFEDDEGSRQGGGGGQMELGGGDS